MAPLLLLSVPIALVRLLAGMIVANRESVVILTIGAMVVTVTVAMLSRSGMIRVAGTGILLNAIILINKGGMPVTGAVESPLHTLVGNEGVGGVYLLADILPVPGGYAVSLGDMLLFVGVVAFLVAVTSRPESHSKSRNCDSYRREDSRAK